MGTNKNNIDFEVGDLVKFNSRIPLDDHFFREEGTMAIIIGKSKIKNRYIIYLFEPYIANCDKRYLDKAKIF